MCTRGQVPCRPGWWWASLRARGVGGDRLAGYSESGPARHKARSKAHAWEKRSGHGALAASGGRRDKWPPRRWQRGRSHAPLLRPASSHVAGGAGSQGRSGGKCTARCPGPRPAGTKRRQPAATELEGAPRQDHAAGPRGQAHSWGVTRCAWGREVRPPCARASRPRGTAAQATQRPCHGRADGARRLPGGRQRVLGESQSSAHTAGCSVAG